jgi:hypothetical protein
LGRKYSIFSRALAKKEIQVRRKMQVILFFIMILFFCSTTVNEDVLRVLNIEKKIDAINILAKIVCQSKQGHQLRWWKL